MKKTIILSILTLCFSSASLFAQTDLKNSEQSNVGGAAQSQNFAITSGIGGQPSPVGQASSAQFSLASGFIPTLGDFMANLPPVIDHTAVTVANKSQNVSISATITDDSGLQSVTLNYRRGGDGNFTSAAMTNTGDVFQGTIPGNVVGDRGVEYFIDVTDLGGIMVREGSFSIQVSLPDPGVIRGQAEPSGSVQSAYHLVSIPISATNNTAAAVLEDDLGEYDDTKWRFFELLADQNYREFNQGQLRMTPGKSFWLIVRDAGRVIDTGAGSTNRIDADFPITLNPGFTFVANPFNFAVPVSIIYLENGTDLDIRSFNGSEFVDFTGSLQPFSGYAVFSELADRLFIDPNVFPTPIESSKENAVEKDPESRWSVRISAHIQNARDTQTFAEVASDAATGWDKYDRVEAPVIGEYVSVYFPHPEWGTVLSNYTKDVRPEPANGEVWEFEVRTNIRDEVKLHFDGILDVPEKFEVWLVDEALGFHQNLRELNVFSIAGGETAQAKRLQLVVGRKEFVDTELPELQTIPTSFELEQNFPNPFNPATTIRYGLSIDSRVTLKIFNLLGKEIISLVNNEPQKAGFHIAIWNGKNRGGQTVASGIYVYQLRAGDFGMSKKMAFLK